MPECRNDCVEPLLFPKRPQNRPGLSHINYRIGTYADFRDALLRHLNLDPLLGTWTHRDSDDPGIALLEGAAILGDILTFYQELYANEAYLRTAQWRESIADLVRLLGYRLSPGLGGRGIFAFEIGGDKPVVIPKGFPITAQVTGLEEQADFETTAEFLAVPALSAFALYRPFHHPPITTGSAKFSIETAALFSAGITFEQGDRVMLVASPTDSQTQRQIAVVAEVRQHFEHTEITIEGSWQGTTVGSEIAAYKLDRSFRYFGYNAPAKETVVVDGSADQIDVNFTATVAVPLNIRIGYLAGIYYPLPNLLSFPLDQEVDDISVGSLLLLTLQLSDHTSGLGETYFFERSIRKITAATLTRGSLTGGSTVVELNTGVFRPPSPSTGSGDQFTIYTGEYLDTDIRTVELHEVTGPRLTLKAARAPLTTSDTAHLYFYGDAVSYRYLEGRSLQLVQADHIEQTLVSIDSSSLGPNNATTLRRLSLNPPLQTLTLAEFPLEHPIVSVYGNLVEATQGKTEREAALGNGDSRQIFQTFKLPKAPLTYHNAAGETPPETPELLIYVSNRLWQRVPSLFNRGSKEEIYIVREDANGDSWVQFGDGQTGARLPSGLKNINARYRTGNGAYGPLSENTNAQAGGRLDRLQKIRLPGVVSGGAQPEPGDKARSAAPGKVQSLDRLVSLQDFESETLAIPGVVRASAAWDLVDNVPAVVITLLMETGREAEITQVRQILAAYNRCRGPQRFPILVREGRLQYLYLDASLAIDPALREELIMQAVKQALGVSGEEGNGIDGTGGLLAVGQRRFGEKEYASRIAGTIQNVAGVLWARVKGLGSLGTAPDLLTLVASLPAAPWPLTSVIGCDADKILSLHTAHLQLSAVKAPVGSC